jgi:asparagine synthase (glutamine-hydrolysing)
MAHLGLNRFNRKSYTDYPQWMREEPARSLLTKTLDPRAALSPAYIPADEVQSALTAHLNGEDRSEKLCRILTFEIWLQQAFEGKYREMVSAGSPDYALSGAGPPPVP